MGLGAIGVLTTEELRRVLRQELGSTRGEGKDWLSVQEVARRLQRTPRSVYRYLDEGTLVGQKTKSGCWLIAESAVQEFLAGNP